MKTSLALLTVSALAIMGAKALLVPCNERKLEDTPFGFLVRMCETSEETKNFTNLLLTELLDEKKAPNTNPILKEYASHFETLKPTFCKELKAANEARWAEFTKPEYPVADDIYDVLICHRETLQSFLDSNPPELQSLPKSTLADFKWLIDNSERLHEGNGVMMTIQASLRRLIEKIVITVCTEVFLTVQGAAVSWGFSPSREETFEEKRATSLSLLTTLLGTWEPIE